MADFRFKLVAELANPYLSTADRRRLITEKASIEYEVPGQGRRQLSESCIRKWYYQYRKFGKEGLTPRSRRDSGASRVLSEPEAALLLNHLEAKPHLTAIAVLRKLQENGQIRSNPSTSSLSRLIRSAGLQRERRMRRRDEEKNLKFDFFAPLECVQADCMYSVKVPGTDGRPRHAILLLFLDDATRRVLYATFSFTESSLAFEAGIRHILAAHGRIGRLYCDNGGPFVSTQTQRILDTLGLVIIHSRVGKPAGRGKIERFVRTTREQFFRPLQEDKPPVSLQELDQRFHSWLESEYHRCPHRGLGGKTPLQAWVEKAHHIIPTDPAVDLQRVFFHQDTRMVYKDSTITLKGVLFEVPSDLIGQRITVRYDPHIPPDRRRLWISHQGQEVGEARLVDSYANARVRRGELQQEVEITELQSNTGATGTRRPVDNSLSASRLDLDQGATR
jgi:transposase InsO family protein